MKEYNPVTAEVIDALKAVVGDKYVKTDADVLDVYKSDESLAPSFWLAAAPSRLIRASFCSWNG